MPRHKNPNKKVHLTIRIKPEHLAWLKLNKGSMGKVVDELIRQARIKEDNQ